MNSISEELKSIESMFRQRKSSKDESQPSLPTNPYPSKKEPEERIGDVLSGEQPSPPPRMKSRLRQNGNVSLIMGEEDEEEVGEGEG
jgi:hypothetical protein